MKYRGEFYLLSAVTQTHCWPKFFLLRITEVENNEGSVVSQMQNLKLLECLQVQGLQIYCSIPHNNFLCRKFYLFVKYSCTELDTLYFSLSFFSPFSLKALHIKTIVNIIYGGETICYFMSSNIFFIFTSMWNLVLEHSTMEFLQRFEWWLWCLLLLFDCNHLAKVNTWNLNVLVFCCLLYKGEYFYARKDSCS